MHLDILLNGCIKKSRSMLLFLKKKDITSAAWLTIAKLNKTKQMKLKKPILILVLVIVLALAFRIPAVLNSKSFWLDEIVSLEIAKKGIIESWQYLKWENNPPLHYWLLHFWIKLFNTSEIALRLSSVLFGVLSILAIYLLGKKLANQKVGLLAGFLIALSSYQLFLAMDARMYLMLLTFGILSCYYFWQALHQPRKINWILYP